MLYFNSDEERDARVEKMFEELHRPPAPPRPATWILLTAPGLAPTLTLTPTATPPKPAPKLTLVPKSK